MTFKPGRYIYQECKAGGMRFWKPIVAKSFNLIEHAFCKLSVVATSQHALNQLVFKVFQAAAFFPSGHSAAQLVGLAAAKSGCDHSQLYHLFLKYRHTQRSFQYGFDFGAWVGNGF